MRLLKLLTRFSVPFQRVAKNGRPKGQEVEKNVMKKPVLGGGVGLEGTKLKGEKARSTGNMVEEL